MRHSSSSNASFARKHTVCCHCRSKCRADNVFLVILFCRHPTGLSKKIQDEWIQLVEGSVLIVLLHTQCGSVLIMLLFHTQWVEQNACASSQLKQTQRPAQPFKLVCSCKHSGCPTVQDTNQSCTALKCQSTWTSCNQSRTFSTRHPGAPAHP